jgi:hypothetical protein
MAKNRGTRGKRALVAAVQTDEEGHSQRMRLSCVSGFRLRQIAQEQRASEPPGQGDPDGLWCFAAVTEIGCTHRRVPMERPDQARRAERCSGSTPCWVTSRTPCTAPTMRSD